MKKLFYFVSLLFAGASLTFAFPIDWIVDPEFAA